MGQFLFLFFLLFFCFDFVPFVGDPRECRCTLLSTMIFGLLEQMA